MRWFRRRPEPEVTIGWAVLCCGEHMYSAEEVRMHEDRYHPGDEQN